jgi:AMMECR1 domain-containing protein
MRNFLSNYIDQAARKPFIPKGYFQLALVAALASMAVPAWCSLPPGSDRWQLTDRPAQRYILVLARRAFDAYATDRTIIDPPSPLPAFLKQRSGVFISTMRNGAPRTCMGTLYPEQPNLAEEIIQNAVASACRDYRFHPVKVKELPQLNLIVSIVGTPRPIDNAELSSLDPAQDGLVVKYGERYGVVLSGETFHRENMLAWGCARAGAKITSNVELFRIHDIRFMESQYK